MAGNTLGLGAFERVVNPSDPLDSPDAYSLIFYNDGDIFGYNLDGDWQTRKLEIYGGLRGLPDNYRLIAPPSLWRW